MARSSSSRSSSRSSSAPRSAPRAAPPPAARPAAPPPMMPQQQQSGGGFFSSMASMVGQGMAVGVGSGIGHRAVDAVMGPRTMSVESAAPAPMAAGADACASQNKAFIDCLNANNSDMAKCQFYLDMLNQCKRA